MWEEDSTGQWALVPERNNWAEVRGKPGREDMKMGLGRVVRRGPRRDRKRAVRGLSQFRFIKKTGGGRKQAR